MDRLYLESVYKLDILTSSPTPPLKGGAILLPSPLRGEGKGEGVKQFMDRHYLVKITLLEIDFICEYT